MLNYNKVLYNQTSFDLTDIEKEYINIFTKSDIIKDKNEREERIMFREECIKKYQRCIITNVFSLECDACHIVPYSIGYNNINNSLLLTKNLHDLFDKGYWTIDSETGNIMISDEIINENTTIHLYKDVNVRHILNEELSKNLEWHNNNIFMCTYQ